MTTLVLQHFEKFWENGLENNNTSFHELNQKVMDFLMNSSEIDSVIITQFEDVIPSEEHQTIISYCEENNIDIEFITYGYGWEKDPEVHSESGLNYSWCYGTRSYHDNENDIIEIEEWQRNLKGQNILLAGAFYGECVLDMETAFDALKLNYECIDELIVGNGIVYEWKGTSPEEMSNSLNNVILEHEEKIQDFYEEYNIDSLEELIEYEPEYVRNLEESLNVLFLDNIDILKYLEIPEPFSKINEINEIISFLSTEEMEHEEYYFKTEESLKKSLFTKISENLEPKTYYHGTFWEKPDSISDLYNNCFTELNTSASDLDVVYLSNSIETAEWFSSYNLTDNEREIPCVLKVKKHLNKTFEWNEGDERNLIINNQEIDFIDDREDVFKHFKNDYDAVIIKNNYPELGNGDDIACLNDINEDEISKIKLFLNNEWTEFMEPESAINTIKNNFLKNKKTKQLKM